MKDKRTAAGRGTSIIGLPEDEWQVLPLPPEAIAPSDVQAAEVDPDLYGELDYMAHCCAAFRIFEARHGRRPVLGPDLDEWVQANVDFLRRLEPTAEDYDRAAEALEAQRSCKAVLDAFEARHGRGPASLQELLAWKDMPAGIQDLAVSAILLHQLPQGEA